MHALTHRSIQLLPGQGPTQHMSRIGKGSLGVGGISRESYGASGDDGGAKYIHCVEENVGEQGNSGVVIEWARRAAATGGGARGGFDVQEVLVKCRVGEFPSQKCFYLLVSGGVSALSLWSMVSVETERRRRVRCARSAGRR